VEEMTKKTDQLGADFLGFFCLQVNAEMVPKYQVVTA
jgi:hypothetical protein